MPFRSLETLESWLTEFVELGYAIPGSTKVIIQDGEDGSNTGLVRVTLANASTVVYIQPSESDATTWVATMEPRTEDVVLGAARLLDLSSELAMVSALCGFLQVKSKSFVASPTE